MSRTYHKIIIITAPSGAGKTSITRHLLQHFPVLAFSVSATTRKARANETHGKDYYFISLEDFKQKIVQDEFIEWEMVYVGNYYGTLKTEIERIWSEGKVPVLDIDVKGAIHVQREYPINTLSIFIEPPSVEVLRQRLSGRGSETQDTLETRVSKASYEITFKDHFDEVIVNDDLQKACNEAETLVGRFLNKPL
ncbi:MAG TPA: guanylate kinase [Ferruginibacter sp.]|nr:guanylate kinase [Ferruginibacter sp.]HRO05505.1 guanylate kinase [Ferruginibacter sp.]HRO96221.1 guanylate kinase [Ferruginibacter sp.]HRP48982.1 guanylate kinase [Ferruginibacter sp.]